MILAEVDAQLRAITQNDHAALAADLLRLRRVDGIRGHAAAEQILWAVREHDNGWREADAAPSLNGEGRIADFREVDDELRQEIWLRAATRYLGDSGRRPASILIVEHGLQLHRDRVDNPAWEDFFTRLAQIKRELLETTGADQILAQYELLRNVDSLALALCMGYEAGVAGEIHYQRQETRNEFTSYTLAPFPYAGSTTFWVNARWLPLQSWKTAREALNALVSASWGRQQFRLLDAESAC